MSFELNIKKSARTHRKRERERETEFYYSFHFLEWILMVHYAIGYIVFWPANWLYPICEFDERDGVYALWIVWLLQWPINIFSSTFRLSKHFFVFICVTSIGPYWNQSEAHWKPNTQIQWDSILIRTIIYIVFQLKWESEHEA